MRKNQSPPQSFKSDQKRIEIEYKSDRNQQRYNLHQNTELESLSIINQPQKVKINHYSFTQNS